MSTQYGYFLIADITGYTGYLSVSELDHAQQTLTALLTLLIKQTRPPLIISRLAWLPSHCRNPRASSRRPGGTEGTIHA